MTLLYMKKIYVHKAEELYDTFSLEQMSENSKLYGQIA